jgi:hypothetical protein
MASLTTFEEVAAQQGRDPSTYSEEEKKQVEAFIIAVSGMITSICGVDFQWHDDEVIYLDIRNEHFIPMPQYYKPVGMVKEVWFSDMTSGEEVKVPVQDWMMQRDYLWRSSPWMPEQFSHNPKVAIRLSYGYKEVPGDIQAIAAAEVSYWSVQTPGIKSEKVGDLEVNYGSTNYSLSASSRSLLKKYRTRYLSAKVVRW